MGCKISLCTSPPYCSSLLDHWAVEGCVGQWSFKLSLNDLVRTAERPDGVLMLQARQRVPHKHQTPHEATLHCDQQLGPGSQQVQSGKCSRRSREPNSKGKGKSVGAKSGAVTKATLSNVVNWVAFGHGEFDRRRWTSSALARHSSENSPGVLPLQSHGKALKQAVVLNAGRLIAPSRHSRGNGFESLQGHRAPAPATSFSDNGQELQAFRPAAGQSVLVWALFDFVLNHSMLAVGDCLGQGPQPHAWGHVEVQGRAKQPPIANPHISGAPPRASTTIIFRSTSVFWVGWEKTRFFDFGVELSRLRSGSDQRPQAMVALCAVATTRAAAAGNGLGRPPDQGQLRLNEKSEPCPEPGTTDVVGAGTGIARRKQPVHGQDCSFCTAWKVIGI